VLSICRGHTIINIWSRSHKTWFSWREECLAYHLCQLQVQVDSRYTVSNMTLQFLLDTPLIHVWKHLYTYTHNHLMALCPWLPGSSRYQKKHLPTHTHPDHPLSTSFIHSILVVQFTCLIFLCHNVSPGSVWSYLVWDPLLHTPYISSPSHQHRQVHSRYTISNMTLHFLLHTPLIHVWRHSYWITV